MKAHDLIHGGLYLIGNSQIVRFNALNGCFYTLDDDFFGNPFEKADSGEIECFTINKNWLKISPIPLTPEILEKNGFDPETFLTAEWEKKVYFREFPGCVVEPDDTGYTFGTIRYWNKQATDGSPEDWGTMYESRIKGLHHVHELQRALRCCGLNELADGFKV